MVTGWVCGTAAALAGLAEWIHWRRCRRIARLAFGETPRPVKWLAAGAVLRALAVGALAWGLVVLRNIDPAPWDATELSDGQTAAIHHLVIALDVSPSMQLVDAGPHGDRRRAERAKEVLLPLVERINWRRTRVSVVAFYTTARPVVVDTFDPDVLTNILDDLPMEHAFQAGKTNLYEGVNAAAQVAEKWAPQSASLIVVSDGDTLPGKGLPTLPAAFAAKLILGLGNPHHGIFIDGHTSRQDCESLTRLALRLGGVYCDANFHEVPGEVMQQLEAAIPIDRRREPSLRDAAIACTGSGAAMLALLPVLLSLVARRGTPQRTKRDDAMDAAQPPRPKAAGITFRTGPAPGDGSAMRQTVRAGRVRVVVLLWLVAPIAAVALHFGPGLKMLARDRSSDFVRAAEAAAAEEDWAGAALLYGRAAESLSAEDLDARYRIELAQASARIAAGEMIEGQEQLEKLLAKMEQAAETDPQLRKSVAGESASAAYYAAWIMRLEGATAEEWKSEAERARQQFRYLAEQAAAAEDPDAESFQKNLEAVIRLEQMDLSVLKARPLPKKCCQCKDLSQRKRKQAQARSKEGKKKNDDIRQQIQKGAGLNEREKGGS